MEGNVYNEGQNLAPLEPTHEGELILLGRYEARLGIQVEPGRTTFILSGDLDVSNVPVFAGYTKRFCAFGMPGDTLAIDASELEFLDSTGLRVVLETLSECRERNLNLELHNPTHNVTHIIDVAGVREELVIIETPTEP